MTFGLALRPFQTTPKARYKRRQLEGELPMVRSLVAALLGSCLALPVLAQTVPAP
ncbi:hypothetical protein [Sphingomonas hankookensis]|uniref:hypothetical protein n=1 Tax=Sphingomonas hankookensis TaxID=563996 RepID=UPI003D303402